MYNGYRCSGDNTTYILYDYYVAGVAISNAFEQAVYLEKKIQRDVCSARSSDGMTCGVKLRSTLSIYFDKPKNNLNTDKHLI